MPSPGSASLALLIAKVVVSVGFVLVGTAAAERLVPSGAFGVCLFNVVAFLCLERLGLALTVSLAYAVDIAYIVVVARLSRPRPGEDSLPAPAPGD